LVAVLSGAPRRISLTDALTTGGRLKRLQAEPFFSETVQVSLGVLHESARRLEIARRLGVNTPDRRLETWANQSDEARAEAFVTSLPTGPRIAIGLGASAAVRTWPVARFGKLLDRLSAGGAVVPVIIVGPHEMALVEALRAVCRVPVYCLAGATLGASIAILRRCTLFIGNDSGPIHLACSVALPAVEISAHPVGASDRHPNSPEKCGPVGDVTKVVRPLLPASDSCSGGCRQLAAHCILGVGVEDVVAAIEALGVLPRDSNREACR
jgi:ADP-heptose:LPS heptosyltransferase